MFPVAERRKIEKRESTPEGRQKLSPDRTLYPFKCGNNSLNAAEEEERINS